MDDLKPSPERCPQCGAVMADDRIGGLCPKCLVVGPLAMESMYPTMVTPLPVDSARSSKPGYKLTNLPRVKYFGDYELLEEIARGGMGVVYKARQASLNRTVALKMILSGHFAGEMEITRFRAEAEAAANLKHPNIVAIHEVGEHGEQHFFSMDYVPGTSLAAWLARSNRGLPAVGSAKVGNEAHTSNSRAATKSEPPNVGCYDLREGAALLVKIVRAVGYAHQRGIIHRDLKPTNILMDNQGEPHLTDFGLAKQMGMEKEVTVSGAVLGTPAYMSPEQALGKTKEITTASDIYSLGAILYHLLTGRPPFAGESAAEVMRAVIEQEPQRPSGTNRDVDLDLDTICLKCLEKESARRYSTADALADDLERWLRQEPILARPSTTAERVAKWARRKPVVAALAVTLALVSIIGMAAVFWEWRVAENARSTALVEKERAKLAERNAMDRLWEACLAQARANRWSGQTGRRFDSLLAISNAATIRPSLELRNEAIACLAMVDLRAGKQWSGFPTGSTLVAFDPEMKRYARSDQTGKISVRRVSDDQELIQLPGEVTAVEWVLRFSPDGQFLAAIYGNSGTARVWRLEQRNVMLTVRGVNQFALDFAPDRKTLVAGRSNGSWSRYDLATGQEHVLEYPLGGLSPHSIRHSPDGQWLAVSSVNPKSLTICRANDGRRLQELAVPGAIREIGWHPAGRLLAAPCADGVVYLFDAVSGNLVIHFEGHRSAVTHAMFSPDGNLLASTGWDGTFRIWEPATGKLLVTRHGGGYPHFVFTDGPIGYTGYIRNNTQLGFLEVAIPRECRLLPKSGGASVWGVQFHPSGQLVAAATDQGVQFWDVERGTNVATIPLASTRSAIFSPDGKWLFTSSLNGLRRWPIADVNSRDGPLQLGASQQLAGFTLAERIAVSADGHTLAAAHAQGVTLFDLRQTRPSERLLPHDKAAFVAISPDGQWVASGTWKGKHVRVWDASTTNLVKDLPVAGNANVLFSPDGRWLVSANGEEYHFWEAKSWRSSHTIPRENAGDIWGNMAFAPDGQLLAIGRSRTSLQLVNPLGGQEMAAFEAGDQQPFCFSPNGRLLVTKGDDGQLNVWDLHLIRQELASLKLNW